MLGDVVIEIGVDGESRVCDCVEWSRCGSNLKSGAVWSQTPFQFSTKHRKGLA